MQSIKDFTCSDILGGFTAGITRRDPSPVIRVDGIASLHSNVGPQGNTLQFAADGIHFSKVGDIAPPKAPGPFRADHYKDNTDMQLTWGVCMREENGWPWLQRFDLDSELSNTEKHR